LLPANAQVQQRCTVRTAKRDMRQQAKPDTDIDKNKLEHRQGSLECDGCCSTAVLPSPKQSFPSMIDTFFWHKRNPRREPLPNHLW
jgi:hypothetical protein